MNRIFILGIAAVLACAATAHAQVSYQYVAEDASGNPITNLSVGVNQTVSVGLYLQETLAGTSTSILNANSGLFSSAVKITRTLGDAGTTVTNNAFFNGTSSGGTIAVGGPVSANSTFSNGVSAGNVTGVAATQNGVLTGSGVTVNDVFLGTLNITGSSVAGVQSSFTLGSKNTLNSSTITFGPDSTHRIGLDTDNGAGSAYVTVGLGVSPYNPLTFSGTRDLTFTVTTNQAAVPEPSSMALCGLVAASAGFGAWRRRKTKLAAAQHENETISLPVTPA